MAETKKRTQFEAETSLSVKIKPAQKTAGKPLHRNDEPLRVEPGDASDEDRKQLIMRIIDYFKSD